MFTLHKTSSFKKEIKSFQYNQKLFDKLKRVLEFLIQLKPLPEIYKDHQLLGKFVGYRECHLTPDILLIYEKDPIEHTVTLAHIGSHSYLFG